MSDNITIIGIDGGASKVSAHIINVSENGKNFSLSDKSTIKEYHKYPNFQADFSPVILPIQLEQIQNKNIELTPTEIKQSKAYYDAFIDAIQEIATKSNAENILIGIGMPGIKSKDERGIIAMANGPRMLNFTSEIENRLAANGFALAHPIFKLGSDADYCGVGEEFAENGAFQNIENAYYLGGGTGAADALKLHGKLVSVDDCKTWFAKTWEFQSETGKSMETYCSARGIQSIYSEITGISQSELIENNIYLEQILSRAIDGEDNAINTWKIVNQKIAELLYERISNLYSGWQNNFKFLNPERSQLEKNQKYKGTLLDKIVIGQRLGNLFKMESAKDIIVNPILNNLTQLITDSNILDDKAKSHYLVNNHFNKDIITTSNLREAPALGAGIEAWNNYAND